MFVATALANLSIFFRLLEVFILHLVPNMRFDNLCIRHGSLGSYFSRFEEWLLVVEVLQYGNVLSLGCILPHCFYDNNLCAFPS